MEILTGEESRSERGSQVSGKSRTWQRVMMMGSLARPVAKGEREGGRRNLVCVIVRERCANAVNARGVSDVLTLILHGS